MEGLLVCLPPPLKAAVVSAQRVAQQRQQYMAVVEEGGEFHVTSETGLDTIWLGARVVASIDPDGSLIHVD
jgi:hypothetical protein